MADSEANSSDTIPNLVATCQQTRFHIAEDRQASEVSLSVSTIACLAILELTRAAPPGLGGAAYSLYTAYSEQYLWKGQGVWQST